MEDPDIYDYSVDLETFSGPMDLLLFLAKKEEVDIRDIPISRITDQYLKFLERLQVFDLNTLGDFLVMASTLMVIKSRMLLPREEIELEEEELDPRADLVQQLLEYRKYKEASEELESRLAYWSKRHPLIPGAPEEPEERPLKSIGLWELFESYCRVVEETSLAAAQEIIYGEIPIESYIKEILQGLQGKGRLSFSEAFPLQEERARVIGIFLALLELVKKNRILIQQERDFGEITIYSRLSIPPQGKTLLPEK